MKKNEEETEKRQDHDYDFAEPILHWSLWSTRGERERRTRKIFLQCGCQYMHDLKGLEFSPSIKHL